MKREQWIASAAIVAAVLVAHGGAVRNEFVAFDDDVYVYEPHVRAGLTADSVAWAFRFDHPQTYFHPLTWLSLMVDREIFGDDPRGYHATNVLLHAAAVLLLFLAFARASGRPWPSAAAALLFGVHPLGVEAVAWAVERKAVLSTALGAGAILSYVRYAERPSARRMALVASLQAASLLAKPALVVLPALLLVLDGWPLGRIGGSTHAERAPGWRRLLLEKVPLAVVSAVVLVFAISSAGAQTAPDALAPPFADKLANAVASPARYLALAFWPSGLAPFHPFRPVAPGEVAVGAVVLAAATAVAAATARRRPWLLAGWAWFLVVLAPYSGLKQLGLWPAYADRFTYPALFGLAIALAFGAAELAGTPAGRRALAAVGVAAVAALTVATRIQVRHWKDSIALFSRAVEMEPEAAPMQYNLGTSLGRAGRIEEARAALERAVALDPSRSAAHGQLATAQKLLGLGAEAEVHYRIALERDPRNAEALFNYAELLRSFGRTDEARPLYGRFLDVAPAEYAAQREAASAFAR